MLGIASDDAPEGDSLGGWTLGQVFLRYEHSLASYAEDYKACNAVHVFWLNAGLSTLYLTVTIWKSALCVLIQIHPSK
jgi:hypothetical protein